MNRSAHNYDMQFFLLLIILFGVYIFWTWNHELAGLGGDNAVYLLTAKFFSPWTPPSPLAEHFAERSQYPPFYPFVMAIFGGGQSILAAHLITTACLLLALIAMRTWLLANDIARTTANLAILLVALLPGTIKISMFLLSENLYLFLSLLALALTSLYEKKERGILLILAAVAVAAATLTRTAGISLTAAFCLYLALRRPAGSLFCSFLAVAPVILHALFKKLYAIEHVDYVDAFINHYSNDTLAIISGQIKTEAIYLWHGWQANFEAGYAAIFIGLLLFLSFLSLAIRVYQRKLDSYYLLFYFVIILLWPYPAEAKRLIYVVLPIIVGQNLFLLRHIPSLSLGNLPIRPVSLFLIAVLIFSLPATALIVARFMQPLPDELAGYRRTKFLYQANPQVALNSLTYAKILIEDIKTLDTELPPDAIIYGIKPSIISLYSQRLALLPPRETDPDNTLLPADNKNRQKFYYMMGITSPSIRTPYYPLDEVKDRIEIVHVARTSNAEDAPLIAILARLKQ